MFETRGACRRATDDSQRGLSTNVGVVRSIQRDASSWLMPFLSEFSPHYAAMKMLLPNIASMSS
jgi:hypothetical protein